VLYGESVCDRWCTGGEAEGHLDEFGSKCEAMTCARDWTQMCPGPHLEFRAGPTIVAASNWVQLLRYRIQANPGLSATYSMAAHQSTIGDAERYLRQ